MNSPAEEVSLPAAGAGSDLRTALPLPALLFLRNVDSCLCAFFEDGGGLARWLATLASAERRSDISAEERKKDENLEQRHERRLSHFFCVGQTVWDEGRLR